MTGCCRQSLLECRLTLFRCLGVAAISIRSSIVVCLSALLFAALARAEDEGPAIQFIERDAWKEAPVELPAFPDDQGLLEVPLQIGDSSLRMFIHEPSLSIGDDGVVRYTMSLRSPSGAENIFYEGIRCSTHELRSYAFATRKGEWKVLEEKWQSLMDLGVNRYRERLYRYYLCQPTVGPLLRKEMLRRMRYGVPFDRE